MIYLPDEKKLMGSAGQIFFCGRSALPAPNILDYIPS
jgi:hypothetical protein